MIMHSKTEQASAFAAEVGAAVRAARERTGLRQDELALIGGVSTRVIHQIEKGKPTSRLDSIIPVLAALGMSLEIAGREPGGGEGES